MNYIIFDLEFNQESKSKNEIKTFDKNDKLCPFEIIQIGIIKLDENLKLISTFDRLIKPHIYTKINPFVEKLTGIKLEDVMFSNSFKEVYTELTNFIEKDSILCPWGTSDIKELFRNIKYYNLDSSLISKKYINIQQYASKYFKCPKGINIGLSKAVELLDIPANNGFHNALNDAYYTAEVFKKIFSKEMKDKTYNFSQYNRVQNRDNNKTVLNTNALFNQFEKIFQRPMTVEEKNIIKIAYSMGKTHQFQEKKKL